MTFGNILKELRTSTGTTQKQLADYLNVTRPTIAVYETKGKEPDYKVLILIASYFHVSTDYLLTGSNYLASESYDEATSLLHVGESDEFAKLRGTILSNIEKLNSEDLKKVIDYSMLLLNQDTYSNTF